MASLVSNLVRDSKDRPQPWEPADFFANLPRSAATVQSQQTQVALLSGLVEARKGEIRSAPVDQSAVDAEFEEVRRKMEARRTGAGV